MKGRPFLFSQADGPVPVPARLRACVGPAPGTLMPRRGLPRNSGMVLFEVMIALTVFTVAAFALVLALDKCLEAAKARNAIDLAVRGLNNQMALLHGSRLQPGETDAPDDGTGVAYHVSIELEQGLRDQKNLPIPNTYRATITATWKGPEGETETRNVSELVYQP